MVAVTSAEFQKNFGRYKDTAQREPVSITSYGRESLVVLSADEYRRLKALDSARAEFAWEMPEADAAALAVAEPDAESEAFNGEQ